MATVLAFPNGITPTSQTFGVQHRNTTFSGGAITQRTGRKTPRWVCQMTFDNLDGDDRRAMIAFLAKCEGMLSSVMVPYFGEPDGTASVDLMTAPGDITNAAWTKANAATTRDTGRVRLETTNDVNSGLVYQSFDTNNGSVYCIDVAGHPGSEVLYYCLGTTPTNCDLVGQTAVVGRSISKWTEAGANQTVYLSVYTKSGAANMASYVDYASVSRCAEFKTVPTSGKTAELWRLAADTLYLKGGNFVEFGGEFKMLVQDLYSTVYAGPTEATFEPAIRSDTLATGDPIIVYRPKCKMMLSSDLSTWPERPHRMGDGSGIALSSFSLSFIEVL